MSCSFPALIVWWLFISGSFINLVIYTSLNDSMKRSISHAKRLILSRSVPTENFRITAVPKFCIKRESHNFSSLS